VSPGHDPVKSRADAAQEALPRFRRRADKVVTDPMTIQWPRFRFRGRVFTKRHGTVRHRRSVG
jgi:hypothetical protein